MSHKQARPQARGSLKEALGKITGDVEIEAQGRAEKHAEDTTPEGAKVPRRDARKGSRPA